MAIRKEKYTDKSGREKERFVASFVDGRGVRRQHRFNLRRDAEAFLAKTKVEIKSGQFIADRDSIDVAEACKRFLKSKSAAGLEAHTLRSYQQVLRDYIQAEFGTRKLTTLRKSEVVAWRDDMLDQKSTAAVRSAISMLRAVLHYSMEAGFVGQCVADGVRVRAAKRDKKPVTIPNLAEANLLMSHATDRWRPLIVTALFTGMRASELRGLAWRCVDFDRRVITVDQKADENGNIGSPKSPAAYRDIPITPNVLNTLKKWKLACPTSELDLVFPNGKGNPERLSNIYRRGLAEAQIAADIVGADGKPRFGMHALRHFFASLLIDRQIGVKRIQTLMGHASIQMTYDTYGHLFVDPDLHDVLADAEKHVLGTTAIS